MPSETWMKIENSWCVVPPDAKYLCKDADGRWWWVCREPKPNKHAGVWSSINGVDDFMTVCDPDCITVRGAPSENWHEELYEVVR